MNLKPAIVLIFMFCAIVLGNGAIPTVISKILLVLGASTSLLPGSFAWRKLNGYYMWCIIFVAFCVISMSWAEDISISHQFITTIGIAYICNIALGAILVEDKKGHEYWLRFFMYLSLLMGFFHLVKSGIHYGVDETRTDSDINMNTIGMIAALSSTIALYFYKHNQKNTKQIQYLFIAAILLFLVLLSGSRKALAMPFIVYAVFKLTNGKSNSKVLSLIIIGLVAIVAFWAVMNIPVFYDMIGYRVEGLLNGFWGDEGADVDSSTNTRLILVELGMYFFAQKPWLGYGVANFRGLYAAYFPGRDAIYAHNNYVELLVDLGVVGTVLYYITYLVLIVKLYKIVKRTGDSLATLFLAIIISLVFIHYGFVAYYSLFNNIILTIAVCYAFTHEHTDPKLSNNR